MQFAESYFVKDLTASSTNLRYINFDKYAAEINNSASTWRDAIREVSNPIQLDDGSGNWVFFFTGFNSAASDPNKRKMGRAIATSETGSWTIDSGEATADQPCTLSGGGDALGEDFYICKNTDGTIYRDGDGKAYIYAEGTSGGGSPGKLFRTTSTSLAGGTFVDESAIYSEPTNLAASPCVVYDSVNSRFVYLGENLNVGNESTWMSFSSNGYSGWSTAVQVGDNSIDVIDDVWQVDGQWFFTFHGGDTSAAGAWWGTIDRGPDDWENATWTVKGRIGLNGGVGLMMFPSGARGIQYRSTSRIATVDICSPEHLQVEQDHETDDISVNFQSSTELQLYNANTTDVQNRFCYVRSVNTILASGGGWEISFDMKLDGLTGLGGNRILGASISVGTGSVVGSVWQRLFTNGLSIGLYTTGLTTSNIHLYSVASGTPTSQASTTEAFAGGLDTWATYSIGHDGTDFYFKRGETTLVSYTTAQGADWDILWDMNARLTTELGAMYLRNISNLAPINTTAPVIQVQGGGDPEPGVTLELGTSAAFNNQSFTGGAIEYRWHVDGVYDSTGATFDTTGLAVGQQVKAVARGTNNAGYDVAQDTDSNTITMTGGPTLDSVANEVEGITASIVSGIVM